MFITLLDAICVIDTLKLIQGSPTKKLFFQCQVEHDNRLSEMGDY